MSMHAVIPVRSGALPVGAEEVAQEANGRCLIVGSDCSAAARALFVPTDAVECVELGPFEARRWAGVLAEIGFGDGHALLPHSPEGRDLAPHLALALGRPLVSAATELDRSRAVVVRQGGLVMETLSLDSPVVATFQPGVTRPRLVDHGPEVVTDITPAGSGNQAGHEARHEVRLIEELPADPDTMDLAEAPRIIAGGAGLGDSEQVVVLQNVAKMLGASVGATRVVTDWGWLSADRQIGTTGAMIDPELYIAVGISGAVQHTAGLGSPEHVVVVNTDPSCPMMDLADLALVCDGPAFLEAFRATLESLSRTSSQR